MAKDVSMTTCLLCQKNEVSCYSSCDECKVGLCLNCYQLCQTTIFNLSKEIHMNCKQCKTKFHDFCFRCQNQTLHEILDDKREMNPYHPLQPALRKLIILEFDNGWSQLTDEMKHYLGDPEECLKSHYNCCDCNCSESETHKDQAQKEAKIQLGLQNISLYERGVDCLLCESCYLAEWKKLPDYCVL